MGLGEAVWADFEWKINSKTSPIDLDRFRPDPADPKIQKNRLRTPSFRRFPGSMSASVGFATKVFLQTPIWHDATLPSTTTDMWSDDLEAPYTSEVMPRP